MDSPFFKRMHELFGPDFDSQTPAQVIGTASRIFQREDVTYRDLFWVCEHLLEDDGNAERVARLMNVKFNDPATKEKTEGVLRMLAEGNRAYEPITSDKILGLLDPQAQRIVVTQEVHAIHRMRTMVDGMIPPDQLEQAVNREIQRRVPAIKN